MDALAHDDSALFAQQTRPACRITANIVRRLGIALVARHPSHTVGLHRVASEHDPARPSLTRTGRDRGD